MGRVRLKDLPCSSSPETPTFRARRLLWDWGADSIRASGQVGESEGAPVGSSTTFRAKRLVWDWGNDSIRASGQVGESEGAPVGSSTVSGRLEQFQQGHHPNVEHTCVFCSHKSVVRKYKALVKEPIQKGTGIIFASCDCKHKFDRVCVKEILECFKKNHRSQYRLCLDHGYNYIAVFDRFLLHHGDTEYCSFPKGVPCPSCCIIHVEKSRGRVTVDARSKRGSRGAKRIRSWEGKIKAAKKQKIKKPAEATLEIQTLGQLGTRRLNILTLGGCLFFPEYHLLVQSHVGLEVTHAIAGQSHGTFVEPGCWHAVVTKVVADEIDMNLFNDPDRKTRTVFDDSTTTVHEIDLNSIDPDRWSHKQSTLKVRWLKIRRDCHITKKVCSSMKGLHPSADQLMTSEVIDLSRHSDVDVVAVLLQPSNENGDWHLGAMIFHNLVNGALLDHGGPFQEELLEKILPLAGNKGLEFKRRGGSCGLFRKSDPSVLRRMLSTSGLLPRYRRAVALVSTETCLSAAWIRATVTDRLSGFHQFAAPQVGGRVSLSEGRGLELLKGSKLLKRFQACRVVTALLCLGYNARLRGNQRAVIRVASEKLLRRWNVEVDRSLQLKSSGGNPNASPLFQMAMYASHTVVCHPVGYHLDTFAGDGRDGIESKIVLVSRLLGKDCSFDASTVWREGRGGLPGYFTWGWMDH